jgi:hypothetical protein
VRKLARCSRGSVAFATVIALVPLIGFVALGAEAASWYVTKQNAQNAADAAAYSGGLTLACSQSTAGTDCDTSQNYIYRGKQVAAQNKFCSSAGDPVYPGSNCGAAQPNTTQTVSVVQGTYTAGAWSSSGSGKHVLATVTQTQPGYLAQIIGMSTVTIRASAVVQIQDPKPTCAIGLGPGADALVLGGSTSITGTGCGLMSNTNVKYNGTPSFTGSGWAVNAVDGCKAPSSHCSSLSGAGYNYNMLPTKNPLSVLDTKGFNSRSTPSTSPCGGRVNNNQTCNLTPNSGGGVYGSLAVASGGTLNLAAGTYFFYNATISLSGAVIGTGVTLVLLGDNGGDSSFTISGGNVTLSAPTTNTFDSDLNGVLIDDQATNSNANKIAVTIGGNSTTTLGGAMYFPNAAVSYSGGAANTSTSCTEVIARSLTIGSNSYLSSSGCTSNTLGTTKVIAMVR